MNSFKPQSLLVTGGAGFIGSNFVHYWTQKYPNQNVVIVDVLTYAGNLDNISKLIEKNKVTFVHANIKDQALIESLLIKHKINTVVHFAAESHVDRSIESPNEFIETNVLGTLSLLNAAKKVWLDTPDAEMTSHRFHHVSTDEVYGSLKANEPGFTEEHQYKPNSPYAASKASSDHLVRSYHETFGLNTTTSNCSNNFGPYHNPEKLIPLLVTNILTDKELPVYGNGQQIRDWLHVEDHCKAIDQILTHANGGSVYNVGGNNEWKNIDIVNKICELIDDKFAMNRGLQQRFPNAKKSVAGESCRLIKHVKDRSGHDTRYAIDSSKIKSSLGFEPQESFIELLDQTIDWYLNHQDWWSKLV